MILVAGHLFLSVSSQVFIFIFIYISRFVFVYVYGLFRKQFPATDRGAMALGLGLGLELVAHLSLGFPELLIHCYFIICDDINWAKTDTPVEADSIIGLKFAHTGQPWEEGSREKEEEDFQVLPSNWQPNVPVPVPVTHTERGPSTRERHVVTVQAADSNSTLTFLTSPSLSLCYIAISLTVCVCHNLWYFTGG